VKYLDTEGENLVFEVGRREKGLLLELLRMYPLVPPAHHRLTSSADAPDVEANQRLLEEALTEHRQENRNQLEAMLQEPERFQPTKSGFRLVLSPDQLEWLLQVLNDVRVGSWLLLDSPDEKQGRRARLSLQNARYFWAMELAGHFQYVLLAGRGQG
jgi:hypothetical protein